MDASLIEMTKMISSLNDKIRFHNDRIKLQTAWRIIGEYDSNPEGFIPWLINIDKQVQTNSFNDELIIKLVLLTTTGPLTDFILNWLANAHVKTWLNLRSVLSTKYSNALENTKVTNVENNKEST